MKKKLVLFGWLLMCGVGLVCADDKLDGFPFGENAKYYFCHASEWQPEILFPESTAIAGLKEVYKKASSFYGREVKYEYWKNSYENDKYYISYPETSDASDGSMLYIELIACEENGKKTLRKSLVNLEMGRKGLSKIAEGSCLIPSRPDEYLQQIKKMPFPKGSFTVEMKKYLKIKNIRVVQTFIVGPYTALDYKIFVYWKEKNQIIEFLNDDEERFDLISEPWIQFDDLRETGKSKSGFRYLLTTIFKNKVMIANCLNGGQIIRISAEK